MEDDLKHNNYFKWNDLKKMEGDLNKNRRQPQKKYKKKWKTTSKK
jgi:hypothetical protein